MPSIALSLAAVSLSSVRSIPSALAAPAPPPRMAPNNILCCSPVFNAARRLAPCPETSPWLWLYRRVPWGGTEPSIDQRLQEFDFVSAEPQHITRWLCVVVVAQALTHGSLLVVTSKGMLRTPPTQDRGIHRLIARAGSYDHVGGP